VAKKSLKLGISTTGHTLPDLQKLSDESQVDFFELGISSIKNAKHIIDQLGKPTFQTIHCLPFLKKSELNFMLNPCRQPIEAAEMAARMMSRAETLGINYWLYSIHAGLLGQISRPREFKVTDRITAEEGIENLRAFKRKLTNAQKIIIENIYGWNEESPAIGMTDNELKEINKIFPLLLDLGHVAVNYELFLKRKLDELNIDNLDIREIHISFLKLGGPPPWDHSGYLKNKVNQRIMGKLEKTLEIRPGIPVVLEISAPYKTMTENIKVLRDRFE
jgi:hypothetical protein